MNCENNFCLYEHQGECAVEEISIDATGRCTAMIYVNIDEKIIENSKTKQLERIDNYD